jgi:Peptidase family M23
VESGYKAQIVDNADGVIFDYSVEIGNLWTQRNWRLHRTNHPRRRTSPTGSDRRPRLRLCIGRTRPARPRRAQRGDSSYQSIRRRAPRVRTPARLPRQGQMANRSEPLDQYGGNHIVQDIGDGNHAFYAHLKPGSIRVKVGDRLTTGQTIASVGNSGNTRAPHLHFHLMRTPDPLMSNGLLFIFDK